MTLRVTKAAPDCGQKTFCLGVVQDGGKRASDVSEAPMNMLAGSHESQLSEQQDDRMKRYLRNGLASRRSVKTRVWRGASKKLGVWQVPGSVLKSRVEKNGGSPGREVNRGEAPQKEALVVGKAPCMVAC